MTEQKVPNQRDIKTESGNYSERIGKHYIQAKQVYITEHYDRKETDATPNKAKCKTDINHKGKATFVLTGTIDSVDEKLLRALEIHLQKFSEDASLTIINIESGSIKLTLEASYEGLEKLKKLIEEGKLTEVLGIPVEYIEFSGDDNLNSKDFKSDYKLRLIQDILSQGARGNHLEGVNLSDADLTGADLCGSNLSNANLVKAKLRHTNLVRANLTGADLNSSDLTGSNLTLAYLDGVNLINGNLSSNRSGGAPAFVDKREFGATIFREQLG
ncbi:pentapeptide repeat-containing protein, partial [Dulcicalothrix desertica]